jgi:hypothetical protein
MSDDAYLTPEAAAAERALAELLEAARPWHAGSGTPTRAGDRAPPTCGPRRSR